MDKISVVLITDDNYTVPTAVTVESIKRNSISDVEIYVLGVGISLQNKKYLERAGAKVIETNVQLPQFTGTHPHVSAAALLKFDLPNIFCDYDKILYLDTDMIILRDLGELFNTKLGTHYAAVVKDMSGTIEESHHIKLKHHDYFNSGMMLLNLKKMRRDDISAKLVDYKMTKDTGHFMDQDCLNAVFNENVIYVSPIYNWMAPNQLHYKPAEVMGFYDIDFEPTLENAVIVHLTNRKKVWNYVSAWGHDLWMKYYRVSVVRGVRLKLYDVNKKHWFGWAQVGTFDKYFLFGIPVVRVKKTMARITIDLFNIRVWKIKKDVK